MISLKTIKETILSIETIDGENATEHLNNAIEELYAALSAMEEIGVRGKDNVDKLLGCIIGIEHMIGEAK